MEMLLTCSSYLLHSCCVQYLRGIPQSQANSAMEKTVSDIIVYHCCHGNISMVTTPHSAYLPASWGTALEESS
jgi:hypothetical protein